MEARLLSVYRYITRNWNAILAGTSLFGVALFSIVPPLQKYVSLFIFLAANAVVWTLIEIKSGLSGATGTQEVFPNMRLARPAILREIEQAAKRSTQQAPFKVMLLGGRIRSMSDTVRELSDDLRSGRAKGHVVVDLYCVDPEYIHRRLVPGAVPVERQSSRNASYALIVKNISEELRELNTVKWSASSLQVNVRHYREDPHIYAYVIGESALCWGTYTWSEVDSDFIGPENPCTLIDTENPSFAALREWIMSRLRLFELESTITEKSTPEPLVS